MIDPAERMWQIYLASRVESAYGLWTLVVSNALVFIVFALSFGRPRTRFEGRLLGGFSAFVIALFTEMYGIPLTLYVLSGWLQTTYPNLDLFSHDAGHLWQTLSGQAGDAHARVAHLLGSALVAGGAVLVMVAWRVLRRAQREGRIASSGPYALVRHLQYLGFIAILLGLLLQSPTALTLAMFPVLVWMYRRLAREEETELLAEFGETYARAVSGKPMFFPRLRPRRGRRAEAMR